MHVDSFLLVQQHETRNVVRALYEFLMRERFTKERRATVARLIGQLGTGSSEARRQAADRERQRARKERQLIRRELAGVFGEMN